VRTDESVERLGGQGTFVGATMAEQCWWDEFKRAEACGWDSGAVPSIDKAGFGGLVVFKGKEKVVRNWLIAFHSGDTKNKRSQSFGIA
jgi:hypothetical protein